MSDIKIAIEYGEDNDGWYIAMGGYQVVYGLSEELARRIVACVNALAHVSTEQLESGELLHMGLSIKDLTKQRDELQAELERERMRLAACGVVAMADTPDGAAKARDMHPDYRSASFDDVVRRVVECIQLRKQRDELLVTLEWLLKRAAPEWESESGIIEYGEACKHARSTIASVKGCASNDSDTDGGSRAGYECPVCHQSDCLGCVKGGAA